MTAAFMNNNYDNLDSQSAAKVKSIHSEYDLLSTMSFPGEYEIEWYVSNGVIGEVYAGFADHGHREVALAGPIGLKQSIDTLLSETLSLGWTGIVRVSWVIDKLAKVTPRAVKKYKIA